MEEAQQCVEKTKWTEMASNLKNLEWRTEGQLIINNPEQPAMRIKCECSKNVEPRNG